MLLPMKPGSDTENGFGIHRNGTCSIFCVCRTLGETITCDAKNQRTAVDWAHQIKILVDDIYPEVDVVHLGDGQPQHPLPRHPCTRAFPPEEAWEGYSGNWSFIYTPKHGSWLTVAEIELNVMTRQCLSRRLGSLEEVYQQNSPAGKRR
jgi:hypothetical protein